MIDKMVQDASVGNSVFISDLRKLISALPELENIRCILLLADGRKKKHFEINLPVLCNIDDSQMIFLQAYVEAELYNTLTTLGGTRLDIYLDKKNPHLVSLLKKAVASFDLDISRSQRSGYGRVINVIDRMLNALHPDSPVPKKFIIALNDSAEFTGKQENFAFRSPPGTIFTDVTKDLDGKVICGLDIGGTDIKAAIAVDGNLSGLKEYDWNPATYGNVEDIIDPIFAIARLMRSMASLNQANSLCTDTRSSIETVLNEAMANDATCEDIESATIRAEGMLKDHLRSFHAIGMCFPDVVVKNKIVGGEVPKTVGMRGNPNRDFEAQFAHLTDLDERLRALCNPNGVVMNTNDGPMAAFTAAVELAASPDSKQVTAGVFAHSLGTDLGTGIVLADGSIPEIPLEVYNLIVDLGSYPSKEFPARDVRSLNNTNTGLAGTLQRFTSQTGAFRLAVDYFYKNRPDLFEELEDRGFVRKGQIDGEESWQVPETPKDMRKPFLTHLMSLPDREGGDDAARIFRDIGTFLSVAWEETEYILGTELPKRFLFGRLVKVQRAFELMQDGAANRTPQLGLVAADSEMAFTPLMRQLAEEEDFTVAQFGQAVGAIYFGNLGLGK